MKWPLSRWFSSSASAEENPAPKRRRLRLEVLEGRVVPAILHVTNLASDNAATAGTLRYEIAHSAANDTVVFDVAGTLHLTNGPLMPSHALTIKGMGPNLDAIVGGSNRIFSDVSGGPLTLSGLTLTGTHIAGSYGAITASGLLTIDNCTITGNSAGQAPAIVAFGGLTLTNSNVSGNTASSGVVGIYSSGTTRIVNSTISGNTGTTGEGGGLFLERGSLTITGSTISGNTASEGAGIYAASLSGSATIANSTITGNTATSGGGGIFVRGNGTLNLVNDTIVANTSRGGSGGGGVALFPSEGQLVVHVLNTIVANNIDMTNKAPDILGTVTAAHSLIRTTRGATFAGGTTTDIFGVDPLLGPLQNNGGPTMTMVLLAGSLAIDAGDDGVLGLPYSLTTDQRGRPRKVGVHVDIGAFEYQPPPPPPPPPPRHGRIF